LADARAEAGGQEATVLAPVHRLGPHVRLLGRGPAPGQGGTRRPLCGQPAGRSTAENGAAFAGGAPPLSRRCAGPASTPARTWPPHGIVPVDRLRSLVGPAARKVMSRKTVMPARSSATLGYPAIRRCSLSLAGSPLR